MRRVVVAGLMAMVSGSAFAPVGLAQTPWVELARLTVNDRADQDIARIADGGRYSEIMVCGERQVIRIRRAEVQLDDGGWQRLFLPLALSPGECSKGIDLLGAGRQIRAVRFDYEAWSPGIARGTVVVRAKPVVQPR
jgi:hypothetical protein